MRECNGELAEFRRGPTSGAGRGCLGCTMLVWELFSKGNSMRRAGLGRDKRAWFMHETEICSRCLVGETWFLAYLVQFDNPRKFRRLVWC